jgi:haloalkane dehalogenase
VWPFFYLRKLPPLERAAPAFVERTVDVDGRAMTYWDEGHGPVMVLLHGNPTSKELWRHMVAPLSQSHRVLVPDLMDSDVDADADCPLTAERDRVLAWLDALGVRGPVVWVAHDWGGAIVIDVHHHRPQRVAAVALCEVMMLPVSFRDYDVVPWFLAHLLQLPVVGALLLVHANLFLRLFMPLGCHRRMTADTRAMYARRYPTRDARRQILRWVQSVPVRTSHRYHARINDGRSALLSSTTPTLLLVGAPGFAINAASVGRLQAAAPAMEVVHLGRGIHYFPEDEPDACAAAIAAWALQKNN